MKTDTKTNKEERDIRAFSLFTRSIPIYESIIGFIFSFGYPFQLWLFYKINRGKPLHRVLCLIFWIAFSFYVMLYVKLDIILALSFLTIPVINLALFIALVAFDLPALFAATGKDAVWDWENRLMGHKLWSGQKTYEFLKWLVEDDVKLGRAKWLLLNFLAHDLEQKFQQPYDPILYEISVHGWPTPIYSNFLAKNMSHARESILWIVDPRDFIRDILPAHIIEVMISISSCLDTNILKKIQKAVDASELKKENLRNLLGEDYRTYCPLLFYNHCKEHINCNKKTKNFKCPEGFSFSGDNHQRHFEHLWFSFFVATLNKLVRLKATTKRRGVLCVGKKKINFSDVKKAYQERERLVGSLMLPHIEQFRNASCDKRRHIYLGMRPTEEESPEERAIKNIEDYFDTTGDYLSAVFPKIDPSGRGYSLFKSLVCLRANNKDNKEGAIKVQLDSTTMGSHWDGIDEKVKRLLLEWALDLFAITTGSKDLIKGVFVTDERKGQYYHDIGIYDKKLEVASVPGNGRKVVWSVYTQTSPNYKIYSPDEKSGLLVKFVTLKHSFATALSKKQE